MWRRCITRLKSHPVIERSFHESAHHRPSRCGNRCAARVYGVVSKLDRIMRHVDNVIDVSVVMSVEKLRQKVEATVRLSGREIHVASEGDNLYAAIDDLADRLDRQVVRHKERGMADRDVGFERKRTAVN